MVRDTVAFLRGEGRRVFLDAEHFFDGYRADPAYALEVLRAAVEAGAEVVALCDTNGGMLPGRGRPTSSTTCVDAHRRAARHPLPQRHRLRGRQHPGRGRRRAPPTCRARSTATASAPATPTCSPSSPTSSSSWAARCCPPAGCARPPGSPTRSPRSPTSRRTPASRTSARQRLRPQGGLHASAIKVDPDLYQHIDPDDGRQRHADAGLRHGRPRVDRAQGPRARLRPRRRPRRCSPGSPTGSRTWRRRATPSRPPTPRSSCCCARRSTARGPAYFDVESWRVITESRPGGGGASARRPSSCIAGGERHRRDRRGQRPGQRARPRAARRRSRRSTRSSTKLELIDYKVRILDAAHGTDAVTRVLIETTDGQTSWETVGVGANIVEASWQALRRRSGLRAGPRRGSPALRRRSGSRGAAGRSRSTSSRRRAR